MMNQALGMFSYSLGEYEVAYRKNNTARCLAIPKCAENCFCHGHKNSPTAQSLRDAAKCIQRSKLGGGSGSSTQAGATTNPGPTPAAAFSPSATPKSKRQRRRPSSARRSPAVPAAPSAATTATAPDDDARMPSVSFLPGAWNETSAF